MIDHLAKIVPGFPGPANQTRCFAHILNLVAKCIMKQFDGGGRKRGEDDDEDVAMAWAEEREDGNESEEEGGRYRNEKNDEMPFDGREGMTVSEVNELDEKVRPVRRVLAKVC